MTEEEARAWVAESDVPRGTIERLDRLAFLIKEEAARQNLIARSTLDQIWSRHIVDSLQLLTLAPAGQWLDIGSGAGFPGLAVACASDRAITLAEPRAKRVQFLCAAVGELGLAERVTIHPGRVESLSGKTFAVISARAVASLSTLFSMAEHLIDPQGCWLLPKGRSAREELASAAETWQGKFRLVPSLTDPEASIVVARDLHRRTGR